MQFGILSRIGPAARRVIRGYRAPPPAPLPEWETRTFFRAEFFSAEWKKYPTNTVTIDDLVLVAFSASSAVDRIQISCRPDRAIIRTLGQKFTPMEIDRITRYKPVGVLWEFEDEGKIYGRCEWRADMDRPA